MAKVAPVVTIPEAATVVVGSNEVPEGAVPVQAVVISPPPPCCVGTMKPKGNRVTMFDFANIEDIKQKVRDSKTQPVPYNVADFYHEKGFFRRVATAPLFENTTLGVIVVNALWISIDTDGNKADTMLTAATTFIVADCLFFAYFSVELFVRFMAFARKRNCCRDGWFVFDSVLVGLYAFDPFTIALMAFMSGGGGLSLPTAVLRLFRLARLSRLVRMLRSLPELMIMIKGMVQASASVGYTLGLLIMVTYVFAIALRNLVPPDSTIVDDYFHSVPESIHNLIIFGTFLDSLSDFILQVKEESVACLILSWLYIAVASLMVMNMLIGVLCEVISAVAVEEKESMAVDRVNDKFESIVATLDTDNDGTLSWEEFKQILDFPEALQALDSVNVNAEFLVDMSEDLFFEDGNEVTASFSDFMGMVLDLRGGQTATVQDMMRLGKRINQKFASLKGKLDDVDVLNSRLQGIDEKLSKLLGEGPPVCW